MRRVASGRTDVERRSQHVEWLTFRVFCISTVPIAYLLFSMYLCTYLHADEVARHLGEHVWPISCPRPYRRNQHVSRLPVAWHSLVFLQPGLASVPLKLHPAGRDSPPCSSSSTPPLSSIPWLMRKKPTACPPSGQVQVKRRRGKLPWQTANEEGASPAVPLTTNSLASRPILHSTYCRIYCFTVPKNAFAP